jgi:hypothetical protein
LIELFFGALCLVLGDECSWQWCYNFFLFFHCARNLILLLRSSIN